MNRGIVKGYAVDKEGVVLVRVLVGDLWAEHKLGAEEVFAAVDPHSIVSTSVKLCTAKIEQAARERTK